MFLALTGTPGTGKSTIASILERNGIMVISLHDLAKKQHFIDSFDENRKSLVIDLDAVERYLETTYPLNDDVSIVFEGHLSHLLKNIQLVIVLRCHPKYLRERLLKRNWPWEKIKENLEAEILDVILCEAVKQHGIQQVKECNTITCSAEEIASDIKRMINGTSGQYTLTPGSIDWSELLFDTTIMEIDTNGS